MPNTPDLRKKPALPGGPPKQNMPIPEAISLAAQKVDAGELAIKLERGALKEPTVRLESMVQSSAR